MRPALSPGATAPLPRSTKRYTDGVPWREVAQADGHPPIPLYDTSGPYTDPGAARRPGAARSFRARGRGT